MSNMSFADINSRWPVEEYNIYINELSICSILVARKYLLSIINSIK